MDKELSRRLSEAIKTAIGTRAERGSFSASDVAEDVAAFLRLDGDESWNALSDQLAMDEIERVIAAKRRAAKKGHQTI